MKQIIISMILLMAGLANAQVAELPEKIEFKEMPVEIEFNVFNDKEEKAKLDVKFFLVGFEFMKKSDEIKGNSLEKVKVKLIPRQNIYGEYGSAVIVKLNNTETLIPIEYDFKKLNACGVEFGLVMKESSDETNELEIKLQNKTVKTASMNFEGVRGIPNTWQYFADKENLLISPLGKENMKLTLIPTVNYSGLAELNFDCDGYKHKEAFNIEGEGKNVQVVGLASLGTVFSGGMNSILLDIVLALIAAVLLVSFIARLVKRYPRGELNKFAREFNKIKFGE